MFILYLYISFMLLYIMFCQVNLVHCRQCITLTCGWLSWSLNGLKLLNVYTCTVTSVEKAISELPFASASKQVWMRNHNYENEFRIQVHVHSNRTNFLKNGFTFRLVFLKSLPFPGFGEGVRDLLWLVKSDILLTYVKHIQVWETCNVMCWSSFFYKFFKIP